MVVEARERERALDVRKRRRRTCVTGEGAENGIQRIVKLRSRSKAIKQNLWLSN